MTKHLTKRALLGGSAMAATLAGAGSFFGPWSHNRAFAQSKPIKLGLTCDASGQYGNSGQDDLRGMRIAIDEFNTKGGVLGRKVEWITADTETNPAAGSRVAERFITREDCPILIGALHSGVANAITQVAAKYGAIYLNTNSSSPSEAAENCSRVKFVWDGNGTNFAKAAVRSAVRDIGKNWLLLTNDYVWGHSTSAATKAEVDAAGGKVMDNLLVPQNTATLRLLAQGAAGEAGCRRGRDRWRRHQGAPAAGRAAEARRQAGLDQQPAGLARCLRADGEPLGVSARLVPQAPASRRRRVC
jgi:branched-chain amino acid transport system substrate-binding protein